MSAPPGNVAVLGQGQPLAQYQSQQASNQQQQTQPPVRSLYFGPSSGIQEGGYGGRTAGTPLGNNASLMQGYGLPMGNPYSGGNPGNPMVGLGGAELGGTVARNGDNVMDVWEWNLEEQMVAIQKVADRYNYVSIDCKFPGIVARPIGTFKSTSEYHYQTLRSNVDLLQAIQIGMSLTDEFGNPPMGIKTWQFNFHFNVAEQMCSSDGVELLRQTGIDFGKHESDGIDPFAFGEYIITSGLVLNRHINWITFHSGYDLGYMLAIMLNKEVPVEERGFLKALEVYFPCVWDVKYIVKVFKLSNSSQLLDIADEFQILRPGMLNSAGLNQAGSDALTALSCFFEAKRMVGEQNLSRVKGMLFGLGESEGDSAAGEPATPTNDGSGVNSSGGPPPPQLAANVFQFGKMGGGGLLT